MLSICAETWDVFSYSRDEQDSFPYLAEYMRAVERHRDAVLEDSEVARRFMLAGLYLSYRACERQGCTLSTSHLPIGRVHCRRLRAFVEMTGTSIESSEQYLWLIGCEGSHAPLRHPGHALAQFVLAGVDETSPAVC